MLIVEPYSFPLNQQEEYECDFIGDQLQNYLAIKQCLLEHDADPVSITPDSEDTMFELCVMRSQPVEPRAALEI